MYCQNCAQSIAADASSCASCGFATSSDAATRSPAGEIGEKAAQQAREAVGSAWKSFRTLVVNPVGGLRPSFENLSPVQVLQAGIVFSLAFAVCFAVGARQVLGGSLLWIGGGESWLGLAFKLTFVGLVLVLSVIGAEFLARKVFRGTGSIEGDLFVSAISLLPFGLLSLLAGLLGIGNAEIIVVLGVIAWCFTVLLLHGGCREISNIREPGASLAVPLILLVSGWLTQVILKALM